MKFKHNIYVVIQFFILCSNSDMMSEPHQSVVTMFCCIITVNLWSGVLLCTLTAGSLPVSSTVSRGVMQDLVLVHPTGL